MKGLLFFLIQAVPNGYFWQELPYADGVLWVGPVQGQFSSTNPAELPILTHLPSIVDEWNVVFGTAYQSTPLAYQSWMDSSVLHIPVMKDIGSEGPGYTHEIAAGQDPVSGFQIFAQAVVYLNPSKMAWSAPIPDGQVDGKTVMRHELGHALGLGDDFQCRGFLMCGHFSDPGPYGIDADAMRGIYCLYGWPPDLPDSIAQYTIFKLVPNTARKEDPCSPWFIYVQGCAGSASCDQITLSGRISLSPLHRPFRILSFVPSRYGGNRCTWVAVWTSQPGDPGVEERNGYLYPASRYDVRVLSPDAPPAAPDGYRTGWVYFSGGYPVKCAEEKRKSEGILMARGRCGYTGKVTVRRTDRGWEVYGLTGEAEVVLFDMQGRVLYRGRVHDAKPIPWRGSSRRGFLVVRLSSGERRVFPVWR